MVPKSKSQPKSDDNNFEKSLQFRCEKVRGTKLCGFRVLVSCPIFPLAFLQKSFLLKLVFYLNAF